ncbi:hypothetical protein [Treponema putidum]|nr:hypothetical protein [Treponema putidum]UTY30989.1 hypothetical protein E4N75_05185 [Treponema putidum]
MKHKIILSLLLSVFVVFLTSCFSLASFSDPYKVMSVEDFEKKFISSLEKDITSKDYLEYLETYYYICNTINRNSGPIRVPRGGDEFIKKISIERENENTAARNIMQIQKYRDHYMLAGKYKEFAKLLSYTNGMYPDIYIDYIKSYNHIKRLSETDFSYVGKAAKELLKDTKYETKYNEYTAYIKNMHLAEIKQNYIELEKYMAEDNLFRYLNVYNKLIVEIKAAGMEINSIDEKYQ